MKHPDFDQQFEDLHRALDRGERIDLSQFDSDLHDVFRVVMSTREMEQEVVFLHKSQVKEQVLRHVEHAGSRRRQEFYGFMYRLWRPKLALALVLAVFVSSIGSMHSLPTVAYAQRSSVAFVQGEVLYKHRDQGWQSLSSGYGLSEGDQIKTSEGAIAELRFFDDRVIRLNGSSWAKIVKLSQASDFMEASKAHIELHSGELYGASPMVMGEQSRVVVEAGGIGVEAEDSSFVVQLKADEMIHVHALDQGAKISMLDLETDSYMAELHLPAGQAYSVPRARVQAMRSANSPSLLVKRSMRDLVAPSSLSGGDVWLALNLQLNEQLGEKSQSEVMTLASERAGVLPGSVWYPIKQATETVQGAMVFSDSSINTMRLQQADRRFYESCLLSSHGRVDEAAQHAKQYHEQMDVLVAQSEEDPAFKRSLLKTLLNHHRLLYKTGSFAHLSLMKDPIDQHIVTLLKGEQFAPRVVRSLSSARLQSMKDALVKKDMRIAKQDLDAYKTYTKTFILTNRSDLPLFIRELNHLAKIERTVPTELVTDVVVLKDAGVKLLGQRLSGVGQFARLDADIPVFQVNWSPSSEQTPKVVFDLNALAANVTTKSFQESASLDTMRLKEGQIKELLVNTRSAINSTISQRDALILVNDDRNTHVLAILEGRLEALETELARLMDELNTVRSEIRSVVKTGK